MTSTLKIDTVTTLDGTGNITFSRPIAGDGSNLTGVGKILQVVSVTKTDVFSATNGVTWVDVTGLSVAITPSATSSKILVCWNVALGVSAVSNNFYMRMLRGSTAISVGDAAGSRNLSTGGGVLAGLNSDWRNVAGTYLDSPATTSATTYKTQIASQGSITKYVNQSGWDSDVTYGVGRTASTITLMEVGA